jgi:hypothetical protein
MLENEFIKYEEALALKELGFDEPCFVGYSTSTEKLEYYSRPLVTKDSFTVDAPTFSQAFRWFREKYGIISFITYTYYDGMHYGFKWIKPNGDYGEDWKDNGDDCKGWYTYEEAELACLKKLIDIVKNK